MSEYTQPMTQYCNVPIARFVRADASLSNCLGPSCRGGDAWD